MKKRNLKLMILTLAVASFLSSNITVFAKPANVEKSHGNSNQHINNVNKDMKKYSKKAEKEAYAISHRLDDIEISLKAVTKKIDIYLNNTGTGTNTGTDTTTGSSITTGTDTNIGAGTTTGADTTAAAGTNTGKDTNIENSEEAQDLSGDFENEYKEEDNGRYNSFYGKLNAINNRLNTVERQLSKISDSGNPELDQLKSRVDSLKEQVKASMDSLGKIQKENVEKIKTKSDRKQMKEQKVSQDKKSWKISFTKELKTETVNSKNIMITDSNNNLIDADISYDKNSKSVTVNIKDGFNAGETYTILIGNDVQSAEGVKLASPVEKKFTVN